ncbi:MAG: 1,2-phenylacetyl-CoA epoxidase subunit PaaD [Anaerolineae bacterium]
MTTPDLDLIWQTLNTIADPEIPVVTLVELGVVRKVQIDGDKVIVTITPTFAACPAMHHMREEIIGQLRSIGCAQIDIRTSLNPPWTSEWLSDEVRSKLRQFGLAPPPHHTGDIELALQAIVTCPHCGSNDTVLDSPFGPTLCQSIHYCRTCRQSFQRFKPL